MIDLTKPPERRRESFWAESSESRLRTPLAYNRALLLAVGPLDERRMARNRALLRDGWA